MSEIPYLVKDLALILVVAGIVTLIFKKLKQPLVLGYIVAGFLVSSQVPFLASVVDKVDVKTWADIGVMFLLFSLGLDFSFKKIIKMGIAPVIAAITIIFCMMMAGMSVGKLFGWGQMDCIFLSGMLAMSSTTIIYKAFDDMGLRQQNFASMVMSVLILEDVLAIVMMVMLSAVASGANLDGEQMFGSVLRIVFFLILWFVVGIFLIPLLLRKTRKLMNEETLLIVSLGLCCLMAVISTQVGFSSAFGAFVMGSILAETVESEKIIHVTEPVKNLFGAIFFVSVGMLVEPQVLVDYALPIIVLVFTILIGQAVFGSFGYLISGQSLKSAMKCGFSMAQIGEFAFIIASLGLSLGVISEFLYPVVVAVSVITTFLTPYMIRFADPAYSFMERRLPGNIILMLNKITLSRNSDGTSDNKWKPLLTQMAVNTVIYSILSVAVIFLMLQFCRPFILTQFVEHQWIANLACGLITLLLIAPFLRAIVMKKNRSEEFKALWAANRVNHLWLIFTIAVRMLIACAFVFYICYSLFHSGSALLITIAVVVVALIIASRGIKKSSIRLERLFLNNLRSRDIEALVSGKRRPLYEGHLLDRDIHIAEFDVPLDSLWAGQALNQLQLGSKFGVHVSSILRASRRINIPDGNSIIFPGDRIRAIGSDDQLQKMRAALENEVYGEDLEFEKREMHLHQIVVTSQTPFVNMALKESGIRDRYNCMVVGLEEGKENLSNVSPNYRFKEGDIIWIVGEEASIQSIMHPCS
ncbi:MAG: cation:proton antiporter [Prevotella sp.]|nr:cation:proton antiporter [Prevotella sp.]